MSSIPSTGPSGEPGSYAEARRQYEGLRRGVVAVLVLACATPLTLNLVDPDLWGHVRYAQDWIADGQLHRTATHTYTAVGHPWINHENLAELWLAYGYEKLGVRGLLVGKCLLGMAVLGMMWVTSWREGVRPVAAWSLFLLVAYNLQAFFPLRPQLLSFLWCAAMLVCVDRAFAGWGNRRSDFLRARRRDDPTVISWLWLALLPPLMAVWANSHGGFVAGLGIVVCLLVGRALELVWRQGGESRRLAAGLVAVAIACGLATLLNPYGWSLHLWLLQSLGTPRPEITEWGPPRPGDPVFWPFVALAAVAVVAMALTKRKRDPVRLFVLILVGWQAATHLRHVAFFALLCGFWLPPHLQSIAGRLRNTAAQHLPTAQPGVTGRRIATAALAFVLLLQTISLGQRLSSLPVDAARYPVDALEWMSEQRLRGNLLVSFNWAQYAIAALAPDVKVAFDGRFRTCYPQEVIDRHFDFLVGDTWPRHRSPNAGPIDGSQTLRVDRPDYVLVDRSYPHASETMAAAAAAEGEPWTLVYQDAVAAVWGRTELVDADDSPRRIATDARSISERRPDAWVQWPALPSGRSLLNPETADQPIAKGPTPATPVPALTPEKG